MKNVQIPQELFMKRLRYHLLDDDNCEDTCATESANELTVLVELIKLSTPLSNWLNPPLKLLAPLYAESIPLFILLYDWSNLFALLT